MVDLFEEVEEELRADQYKRLARFAAPWLIILVAAVVVVGGGYVGWYYWNKSRQEHATEAVYAALQELQNGDAEGSFKALAEVADKYPATFKWMAYSIQAAIRDEQGQTDQAVKLMDQSAEAAPKTRDGLILADTSRLKSAWLLMDTASYSDIEARLKPLTASDRPLTFNATEALALAKVKAGKMDEARNDFLQLSVAADAPEQLTQRAQYALRLIDSGAAAQLADIADRAMKLPPPVQPQQQQIPPELLEQLQRQAAQQGAAAQ